jgi:hypothetical protein
LVISLGLLIFSELPDTGEADEQSQITPLDPDLGVSFSGTGLQLSL